MLNNYSNDVGDLVVRPSGATDRPFLHNLYHAA